jgi:hypothetical protein
MRPFAGAGYPSSPHATIAAYQAHFYTCALAISERHAVGATMIVGLDGTYAMPLSLTYRYSDSLLFDLKYVALGGAFFKDRSQLAMRVPYLLN